MATLRSIVHMCGRLHILGWPNLVPAGRDGARAPHSSHHCHEGTFEFSPPRLVVGEVLHRWLSFAAGRTIGAVLHIGAKGPSNSGGGLPWFPPISRPAVAMLSESVGVPPRDSYVLRGPPIATTMRRLRSANGVPALSPMTGQFL